MNHLDQKANKKYEMFLNAMALDDEVICILAVKMLGCCLEVLMLLSDQTSLLKSDRSTIDRKHLEEPFL